MIELAITAAVFFVAGWAWDAFIFGPWRGGILMERDLKRWEAAARDIPRPPTLSEYLAAREPEIKQGRDAA